MDWSKKMELLDEIRDKDIITDDDFVIIKSFAFDEESIIRSRCAEVLIDYISDEAKELLFELINDEDELVRLFSYETLGVYHTLDVSAKLHDYILLEEDDLARSYALLSWSDIQEDIADNHEKDIEFLKKIRDKEESQHCILSCDYGLYKFNVVSSLDDIIKNLNSEDSYFRNSALNLMKDLINDSNKKRILTEVSKLISHEDYSTSSYALNIMEEYS